MLENLIQVVSEWLEMKGFESEIDYDEDIITYEDEDDIKILCKLDEKSLLNAIEKHDMDSFEIIE